MWVERFIYYDTSSSLQGLTQVEEMLISIVLPILSVYRLLHGQYGYSGHVINLPQDTASFVNSLPRLPAELDVLMVRKEGAAQSHYDFRVRKSVVLRAIQWLVQNNTYYQHITINTEALALLPEDGDLTGLCSVTVNSTTNDQEESQENMDDPYNTHLEWSFVPIVTQRLTEQEKIRQSVHQNASQEVISWPAVSASPVNEFNTEGYMSQAFPTLFPTGAADFLAPRPRKVTVGNYFKHLVMYKDGRFARHCRFRYFALNTEMRWRALQTGRIYVHQHPHDARLSVEELRDMVGRQGEAFSNRVLHFATSLRGMQQYWMK